VSRKDVSVAAGAERGRVRLTTDHISPPETNLLRGRTLKNCDRDDLSLFRWVVTDAGSSSADLHAELSCGEHPSMVPGQS
jgi:hypothetical protein